MKRSLKNNQSGIAHIALIVIAVVVIGAVGFAGWRVMQNNKSDTPSTTVTKEEAKEIAAECKKELNDDDLCKFFSSSANAKKFSITSTDTSGGTTTTSLFKIDGENTYMKTEGEAAMEIITIGKTTTYTKAGDTWWKKTITTTADTQVNADDFKFEEPSDETPEAQQTKYEKQGKEACGDKQCFKYKVIDPSNTESTEYIWFDDKDYLIVKTRSENKDGSVSEQVYSYENVSVTEPTPVKELGADQYIMPGQTEPTTIPSAGQ